MDREILFSGLRQENKIRGQVDFYQFNFELIKLLAPAPLHSYR